MMSAGRGGRALFRSADNSTDMLHCYSDRGIKDPENVADITSILFLRAAGAVTATLPPRRRRRALGRRCAMQLRDERCARSGRGSDERKTETAFRTLTSTRALPLHSSPRTVPSPTDPPLPSAHRRTAAPLIAGGGLPSADRKIAIVSSLLLSPRARVSAAAMRGRNMDIVDPKITVSRRSHQLLFAPVMDTVRGGEEGAGCPSFTSLRTEIASRKMTPGTEKGTGRDALQPGHRQGVGRERSVGLERIGVPRPHTKLPLPGHKHVLSG